MKTILILLCIIWALFAVYVFAGGLNMQMQISQKYLTTAPAGPGPVGDGLLLGAASDYAIFSPGTYPTLN